MPDTVPQPPYVKAPITEGVIHLSVADTASADDLQKLVRRLRTDYPHQEGLSPINVTINTTAGAITLPQPVHGYRLKSTDQADIVVILTNGITTSRLAPYPGWEHLRDRARSAWSEWRRIVKAGPPQRIGIRYLNRIDIPIDHNAPLDTDDYLTFTPRIPNFSNKPLAGFLVQATKPTESEYWNTTITSYVAAPSPLIGYVSLVLDVDVFRTEKIPGRDSDLWNCIDAVRPLKNSIFEACITDKTRRLFV